MPPFSQVGDEKDGRFSMAQDFSLRSFLLILITMRRTKDDYVKVWPRLANLFESINMKTTCFLLWHCKKQYTRHLLDGCLIFSNFQIQFQKLCQSYIRRESHHLQFIMSESSWFFHQCVKKWSHFSMILAKLWFIPYILSYGDIIQTLFYFTNCKNSLFLLFVLCKSLNFVTTLTSYILSFPLNLYFTLN